MGNEKITNNDVQKCRRSVLCDEIAAGFSVQYIVRKHTIEWGVSEDEVKKLINEVMNGAWDEESKETLRNINLQRLDDLYHEQLKQGDIKSALKVVDLMNKTANLYRQDVKVDTTADIEVKFNF